MTEFNLDSAREAYSQKETKELIRIAFFEGGYLPQAVEIAKEVLLSRGISSNDDPKVVEVEQELIREKKEKEALANEPLHIGWKIYCFLIADFIALAVIIVKASSGKKRASKEALKFFFAGWVVRVVVFAIILNV